MQMTRSMPAPRLKHAALSLGLVALLGGCVTTVDSEARLSALEQKMEAAEQDIIKARHDAALARRDADFARMVLDEK
jgi:hypothetical protein